MGGSDPQTRLITRDEVFDVVTLPNPFLPLSLDILINLELSIQPTIDNI